MLGPSYEPISQNEEAQGSYSDVPRQKDPADELVIVRPPVYYNDGPFSPQSSVDESEEHLLEKTHDRASSAQRDNWDPQQDQESGHAYKLNKRAFSTRCFALCLVFLLGFAVVIGIFAGFSYSGKASRTRGSRHITMDHIFNGTFFAEQKTLNWVPEAGDGVFSINDNGFIKLTDVKANTTTVLLQYGDVRDTDGRILVWDEWKLSPDMNYVLMKADHLKQWRSSSFGNYYIHKLSDHTTRPLTPPTHPPTTSYATWSPTGESVAFVSRNDLYVLPSADPLAAPIRVTNEGNSSLFFGVPDWVYEEEVFLGPSALWWSPDSRRIAFLRSDETNVTDFTFPVYNPTTSASTVVPYTSFVTMKYPKPGYPNPLVSLHVFDLYAYQTQTAMPLKPPSGFIQEVTWDGSGRENRVIQEVAWVANGTLLITEITRTAGDGQVVMCDLGQQHVGEFASGSVVRRLGKDGEHGDDGWIDSSQTIYRLPDSLGLEEGAYLDILPTKEGFNQIALFNSAGSSEPRWLTSGREEVDKLLSVDAQRRKIYFTTAGESGIGRNVLSVPIPKGLNDQGLVAPTLLTPGGSEPPAYYSASFSPRSGFYLLSYQGPDVPWQKLIKVDDQNYNFVFTDNARLNRSLNEYQSPVLTFSTMDSDGYELNTLEIRPPEMDTSGRTKYPVLFRVYGGPGSQIVETKFTRDWHHYLACSLGYIVVMVDGRGTGYKGRRLRNPVKNNLGYWETRDQINAAKLWASKPYVDRDRIGIWGWSYGGFMAAKVVEADAGVHSLAMSVAPVISWRLYDSIYTERYMGLPDSNPNGYLNASITNVTAFDNVDYLIAHGSGDDNVHFANTAHLLDMFTEQRIRGFRFRMFTDSDHSISKRGANRELYEFMTAFLKEKWGRNGVPFRRITRYP